MIAQDWDQNFTAQFEVRWLPFNIKIIRKLARLATFQDILPPAIFLCGNAHVVGNDIQHEPHFKFAQCGDQFSQIIFAPDFRV